MPGTRDDFADNDDRETHAEAHRAHVEDALRLAQWLADDDIDTAIDHGLMQFSPCATCLQGWPDLQARCADIAAAQSRLHIAWAARDRHHARRMRLARRAAERAQRHASVPQRDAAVQALPPAAAAALARAKVRAASKR